MIELTRRGMIEAALAAGLAGAFPAQAWAKTAKAAPALFPRLDAFVAAWAVPGRFPGVIAAVGLPGRDPQFIARGTEAFGDPDPAGPDSLYRIYSMTKPITGMAAMILIGEGKLRLDQPLADILPAYANMQVQVVPDGPLAQVRPAKTPITIRHLLTHTAGLGYSIVQKGPLKDAYEREGLVPGLLSRMPMPGLFSGTQAPSLAVFADRLAKMPLVYEPGTKWSYSVALDLMGRVIEVVSGKPFDTFLAERLFGPLGMTSTFFRVPAKQARRLTTTYAVVDKRFIPIDPGPQSVFLDPPPFPFGGAGLVSTPRDYDRFLRMLANGGMLNGRRVMGEGMVRLGTSDLLPPGTDTAGTYITGAGFGAGGRVGRGAEAGIYGWAGAAGTVGMVDTVRGIRSSVWLQFMPPETLSVLGEFQQALRADLIALAARA